MPAAEDAMQALEQLPQALGAAYPRAAHRGRLEQIEQVAGTLRSLVSQLPDEEAREADYESRLLAMHEAGEIVLPEEHPDLDPRDEENHAGFAHPQGAVERLRAALAAKGA